MQSVTELHVSAHEPEVTHLNGVQSVDVPFAPLEVWSSVHTPPGTHVPSFAHAYPGMQSSFDAQLVLHAVVSAQIRFLHVCGAWTVQPPAPLHRLSVSLPFEHVEPHDVVGKVHALVAAPSQMPPHGPLPVHAERVP